MIRSIDVEYKRIEILTENLSQILPQSTQKETLTKKVPNCQHSNMNMFCQSANIPKDERIEQPQRYQ